MNKANGRDNNGRFALGNPGGPGNPYAQRTAELRAAMLSAVTTDDLTAIVAMLVKQAKAGDMAAAREVLDRVLGKSQACNHVTMEGQKTYVSEQIVDVSDELSDGPNMMDLCITSPKTGGL
jgi:hypothetical protein